MGPHLRLLMEPSLPLLILVPINVIIVSMIMIMITYITHQGSMIMITHQGSMIMIMIMITHQGSTTLGRLSEDLVSRVLFCWESR